MLTKAEQRSLAEGSLVRYGGVLWLVAYFFNEHQMVLYPALTVGYPHTVKVTDYLLTPPTAADNLWWRLMGGQLQPIEPANACAA